MITFYYEIPKLTNLIQVEILNMVKKIEDKNGLPDFEEISASDEDDPYLRKLLRDAATEVYSKLSPYSRALADLETPLEGYEFAATYTAPDDSTVSDCVIFRIIEPENFDSVVKPSLANTIENTLINYVVYMWLNKNNANGSAHESTYEKNKDDILKYINRRTKLKRTYKLY